MYRTWAERLPVIEGCGQAGAGSGKVVGAVDYMKEKGSAARRDHCRRGRWTCWVETTTEARLNHATAAYTPDRTDCSVSWRHAKRTAKTGKLELVRGWS